MTIKAYTKDSLSADRRERLEGVAGWEWDPYAEDWDEGFAQLTAYVQAEGHAIVPNKYCTADGVRLGAWVDNQRSRKDSMSAERRQRLESLAGWVWVLPARPSKPARKQP